MRDAAAKRMTKKGWFTAVYCIVLLAASLVGIEAAASYFAPAWPARALRSVEPVNVIPIKESLYS